jgi:oxygen-independent coproporphyrinogen-3 oxidase
LKQFAVGTDVSSHYRPLAAALSAYIHVPFCVHRCGYCDFTLVAGRDDLIEPYLDALARELTWLQIPRPVQTIFVGGGTPTHLRGASLKRLLALVGQWHPLARGGEFSVEANPEDLDEATVAVLAEFGVTRISLGAQSFHEQKLAVLERRHTAEQIRRSVELARRHELDVALDLIFAAPGETLQDWTVDLMTAVSLLPDHISTYGLTFEKGTRFWRRRQGGQLRPADEELERAMYETALDQLTAAGFEHYEVSNFAKPAKRCRHNENYWLGEEYYAAGPGAASYLNGVRSLNLRSTTAYMKAVLAGYNPVAETESLDQRERALEVLVFALRRLAGVDRSWFQQKTGFALDELVGGKLPQLLELGLMNDHGTTLKLTRSGLLVSDSIFSLFLSDG